MKKYFLIFFAFCFSADILAQSLIMIPVTGSNEVKHLSGMDQLSMNYLGNGFVIATMRDNITKDYLLLEKNAWTKNFVYYIVYADETKNAGYRKDLKDHATILYDTEEMLFIKVADEDLQEITPPPDGSLARIWNKVAKMPGDMLTRSRAPLDLDPFIVARMAEVDTGIIHSNIQHLQDYGTRRCTKPEGILAQNWIKGIFESYGLATQLVDFYLPYGSSSDDVIATKTGTLYPDEYVIIGGHYDSYTGGTSEPGADDNATGTCGILEVARILSQYTFDRTIIFCAFSGEEYGLYGSEAYAAYCDAQNMNILGYLNMDMVGYLKSGDPIHTDIIAPSSAQSLVDFYTTIVSLYLPDFITAPGSLSGGDSDHTSFNDHGFMGIFPFEDSQDYSPYIHTSNDLIGPSVNNFAQVGVFTKAILAVTVSLANLVPPVPVLVTGVVTDAITGLPLQNATIQVLNSQITPVTTNSSGEYSISDVTAGYHSFRISRMGYATTVEVEMVTTTAHQFDFQLQPSTAWSFESGSFEPQWTFSGNLPWLITTEDPYDGLYCSRSGAIGDNQTSEMSLELYLTESGYVSFYRKVSSELSYDYLKFYIDGVQKGQWSGILGWEEVNYAVTSGLHTFKWTYSKDANTIGGSDRAWIDYIIFPPIGTAPTPPDISVTPAQFAKTLVAGGTTTDILTISNSGQTALTFTAQVVYSGSGGGSPATVYPLNANYNTGTTTSSAKSQTSLVKGYPTTEAGWMKFDISGIPDAAVITSVEFHGYVNAANYPYWNINPVTVDPVTTSPSVLYADIIAESSSGYYLYRSESGSYTTGWKVHALGGTVNANLQSALVQDWFAIGIMDRDASSSYYIGFDGWNEANKPYLVVTYTYTPPYTWLKVNGASSTSGTVPPSSGNQLNALFEAGSLAPGTYAANIKITSNDPVDPLVSVPCTLNIITETTLNLTLFLEGLYDGSGTMRKAQDAAGNHFSGNIADQVAIELHNASNYSEVVYSIPAVNLSTAGNATVTIPGAYIGSYYLTIRHRNSVETTTAAPVALTGGTVSYNFTASAGQAYGSNLLGIGGVYVIYSGDVNQDGQVNSSDMTMAANNTNEFLNGYVPADLNGDGMVDLADMILLDKNMVLGVSSLHP